MKHCFVLVAHYRQGNGELVRLDPPLTIWRPADGEVAAYNLDRGYAIGARRFSDGKSFPYLEPSPVYDLIPGELIERDGQWAPIDSIDSGAVLKTEPESIPMAAHTSADICGRHPLPESDAWRYTGPKAIGGFTTFGSDWPVYSDPTTSGFAPTPALVKFTCVDCRGCSKCAPFKGTLHAHPGKGSALLRG